MFQRGVRGATTINKNTTEEISSAAVELINEMIKANNINTEDISHLILTMTDDLDAAYGARALREELKGFDNVPMMCVCEQKVNNSLRMCLRAMMIINTKVKQNEIKHIYLREAKVLRKDIANA